MRRFASMEGCTIGSRASVMRTFLDRNDPGIANVNCRGAAADRDGPPVERPRAKRSAGSRGGRRVRGGTGARLAAPRRPEAWPGRAGQFTLKDMLNVLADADIIHGAN